MSNPYSWEDLEPTNWKALTPEQEKQAMEVASLFRQTFTTEAGKKVLEILDNQCLRRPVVTPDSTQFQAGIREGQNDIVRQIHAQIELANGKS